MHKDCRFNGAKFSTCIENGLKNNQAIVRFFHTLLTKRFLKERGFTHMNTHTYTQDIPIYIQDIHTQTRDAYLLGVGVGGDVYISRDTHAVQQSTHAVQQSTHLVQQDAHVDVFLRWRAGWSGISSVPETIVPGMNQLARLVLFFWRKRMPLLATCAADANGWEECLSTIRSVLLDPSLSYQYQGIPAGIRHFAFAAKPLLRLVVADAQAVSLSDLIGDEAPVPVRNPHEFPDRVLFALKEWSQRGGMEQKWVALVVLRQQIDWSDIARRFKSAPVVSDETTWETLRGEMELPTWAEVHLWFSKPPPVIWEDARALRQFYSRFSQRFQSDLLENF
jgi:hypothetical protein